MRAHLQKLSKQVAIYGLGDTVTRLSSLLLLPVYTRFLSPQDYGRLAMALLISTVVSLILELGLRTAFFRFYFQDDTRDGKQRLIATTLLFLLVSSAVILTFSVILLELKGTALFKDPSLVPLVRIALIATFFDLGSVVPFAIFRAEQRAARYAGLSFTRFLIGTTLSIVAVVWLEWGVTGIIYMNLLTAIIFFLICLSHVVGSLKWTIDFKLLGKLLAFGLPLMPASLAGWALTFSDRFFLERYTDLAQVGLYSIAYSIASVLNMAMGWFNTAWLPYCYSMADDPEAKVFYARIFTYALALFTFLALGLTLFAEEALYLFATPAYFGAAKVVPLLALSYLFYQANYLIALGLDLTGRTSYYAPIVGAAAVVNLILNFVLIPRYGMMGAAVSTALSYMVMPILAYLIVRRLYPVPYERSRLLRLILITTGIYLLGVTINTERPWVNFGIGVLLVIAWGGLLYVARFFTGSELAAAQAARNSVADAFRGKVRYVASKVW